MTWAPLSALRGDIASLPDRSTIEGDRPRHLRGRHCPGARHPISHDTVRQFILWYATKPSQRHRRGAVQCSCHSCSPTAPSRLDPESLRTKPKTGEKPANLRKAEIAKLVPPPQRDIDDDADDRQRVGVQSLGRAFGILEEVARHREGIGLADLSKLVGLHNSTTFHLAKTLVSLGYLRQEKDSKRYRIGRPLFALAASALDELEMMSLATPVLEDLSRETGESAHFSVRMGDAVVVLARTSGPGAFQLTDRIGVVRPAHCTALGKVMLAAMAPEQFDRFAQRAEFKAY